MSVKFQCEHCGKQIKAPDEAGGRRGKCPYCKQSCYIPAPVSDEELLDLAPEDEDLNRKGEAERQALAEEEHALLAEAAGEGSTPLDQRDDLTPEDLYHFVVNYCLDMFNGKLEQAEVQIQELQKFSSMGISAVEDFINDKAQEEALGAVPEPVLKGFLKELRGKIMAGAGKKRKEKAD